ncbi:MAG: protein-disulfide isomerase [Rhodothermales bacterium]|jgi:protein-disulfide isomerase
MRRVHFLTVTLALLAAFAGPLTAVAQDSPERRVRIAENLKFRFEQLRDASVEVIELGQADVAGMALGTVVINSQNRMRFLVTDDDSQLFMLAAEAVDVSLSASELAEELKRLDSQQAVQAQQVHAQLLALSQNAPSLGPDDAAVTIIEFSDFQCPFCARVLPTVKQLLANYPDDVRLVFMDLPLNMHPWAEPAAIAGGCAAKQSETAFWSLHDHYFDNQADITAENVIDQSRRAVADSGINMEEWETCAVDTASEEHSEVKARMQFSMRTAQSLGANGTPAFFINGRFISGNLPLADFDAVVQEALTADR